jgi:hypothetical protein
MEHERDADRLPRAIRKLGARRRSRGRQLPAGDVGEVDAAALEDVAILEHARDTATPFRAAPFVAAEGLTVERFQLTDDARLQTFEIVARFADVPQVRGDIAR